MARKILALVAALALIFVGVAPSDAGRGGGGHGGGGGRGGGHGMHRGGGHGHGGHGGHGHHGHHGHHGGCCWWGAFVGGVALGSVLAYPYVYPYSAYPYPYYSYPYYPYPYYPNYYPYASSSPAYTTQTITTQPSPSSQQPQASNQRTVSPQAAVQREVVYSHGKYVLHGDGVTQSWQWVWVPATPASPPTLAYTTQTFTTQPSPSYQQPQASNQRTVSPQAAVQREVVYSHGKYVLHGDGVRQSWQWVWVPATPASPPTLAHAE
jgi:hypothetical protein